MKLQNKKTGKPVVLQSKIDKRVFEDYDIGINIDDGSVDLALSVDGRDREYHYETVEMFKLEWKDYEEPDVFYFIDRDGRIIGAEREALLRGLNSKVYDYEIAKSIGNVFETKEEADKAVEKLKAWKRLRDKGFRFEGWGMFRYSCDDYEYSPHIDFTIPELDEDEPYHYPEDVQKDLDLLFGGEEE